MIGYQYLRDEMHVSQESAIINFNISSKILDIQHNPFMHEHLIIDAGSLQIVVHGIGDLAASIYSHCSHISHEIQVIEIIVLKYNEGSRILHQWISHVKIG